MSEELGQQARAIILGLSLARIGELAAELGVKLHPGPKDRRAKELADAVQPLEPLSFFGRLRRDELRAACRSHGLPWKARGRADLTTRLIGRHVDPATIAAHFRPWHPVEDWDARRPPKPGQIVRVRQRQYFVEDVTAPQAKGEQTLVRLVGLDDDDAGHRIEILWEIELDAQVVVPEKHGLGEVKTLDRPRRFSAYFHAVAWGCTTATDGRLFQAPFRAGIKITKHQLVPLRKALELPRVNLFIADDVGVGKTIEAALVLQELFLRQQIDRVLVVCPAAVTLQWRDEMERRFGLRFEVYSRAFVARRREERGFGINPWSTFPRFIVSYQTLRRPEHWDPLLAELGAGARRSLLILDEAHTVAPASASKYAVDSDITKAIRNLAPRFEHRLFLSATPHNGHSNSFSSLLEVLDPQRFTRGVKVTPERLGPVMVRRLKADLIRRGVEGYPERRIRQIDLIHKDGVWHQQVREGGQVVEREELDPGTDVELELSRLLAAYRKSVESRSKRARLVLVNLQKRLLSSVEAFARTLAVHARSLGAGEAVATDLLAARQADLIDDDGRPVDDEVAEAEQDLAAELCSRTFPKLDAEAQALLHKMLARAEQGRALPGAKLLSLLAWIRRNQCAAVGGATGGTRWSDRRLIVFTEYVDTKRALGRLLRAAFDGTDRGDERLLEFHGGVSDDQREEIARAFNGHPSATPVRVLLATDAAREGLNLHAYCADLIHFDVPWNPARLEQRNGRIDRALQPEKEVRCSYFLYPQRPEDAVLRTLVEKTETIRRELGSLGDVIMGRVEEALADGIADTTVEKLALAAQRPADDSSADELDSGARLFDEEDQCIAEMLNDSQKVIAFSPRLLRSVVNAGLDLLGHGPLVPLSPTDGGGRLPEQFRLPDMDPNGAWAATLDTLRPPRGPDEPFWQWRERPLKPVVFEAPHQITDEVVQLHLQHPVVQRLLARFRAQGWAAHDLSRVTVLRNPHDNLPRVLAIGRLTLFGPSAIRLHEELVFVAARWSEGSQAGRLRPSAENGNRKAVERLQELLAEAPETAQVPKTVEKVLCQHAAGDWAALWNHVESEAESHQHDAESKLRARGRKEADDLREILSYQRHAIERALKDKQLELRFTEQEKAQREQLEADRRHMAQRLTDLEKEEAEQPGLLEKRYEVVLRRLEPVGLVYLYPEVA